LLGLFAKHPDHVAVKTRLARSIGIESAQQVARLLSRFLLDRLSNAASFRQIVCWPPESSGQFQTDAGPAWNVISQTDGDLGIKMSNWFDSVFDDDYQVVIAIGADCPFVEPRHIEQTVELLKTGSDLVLGPAEDGGYWLVGLRRKPESLFSDIQWGTGEVFEATLNKANSAGLKTATLETLRDVDDFDDLTFVIDQLQKSAEPKMQGLSEQLSGLVQVRNS
jgi:rSAM/selenodomain-associated transferase 1